MSLKIDVSPGILLIFIATLSACHAMDVSGDKSFCESLKAVEKNAVRKEVNHFLNNLEYSPDRNQNFESLINKKKKKSCVQEARLINRIILTNPPIAQFELLLDTTESDSLILKITFNGTYKFYDLKTNN